MKSRLSEKKNQAMLLILSALLICGAIFGILSNRPSPEKGFLNIDGESQTLYIEKYDLLLSGTERGGCTYFFLPSYVRLNKIDQSSSKYRLYTANGRLLEKPEENEQDIMVDTGDKEGRVPWKIAFLRSENLCTIYLDPEGTDLFSLSKDSYETVSMKMISSDGRILMVKTPVYIKGRGNASAGLQKKPYELKFNNKRSLCDLGASKKWVLLANASDDTKLYNKMAFDTSKNIGMDYSIGAEWVDLYAGGEYLGNYLLCREPDIGKNDLNIGNLENLNDPLWDPEKRFETDRMKGYEYDDPVSPMSGGYLFQTIKDQYYEEKDCGFKLNDCCFSIKSPNNASREQVEYIAGYAEHLDQVLRTGSESLQDVVDEDSFAKRFLIEEFFYNLDGFTNSYYFYKAPGDDRIFAGPVWDYDNAVGKGWGGYLDHNRSLFEQNLSGMTDGVPCRWDHLLYQDEEYREYLESVFRKNLPVFKKLIEKDIDEYHEKTGASLRMDRVLWGRDWFSGPYLQQESDIRYTKFFLAKRLEWMCERWGIDEDIYCDLCDGSTHEVTFEFPDGTRSSINVKDGEQLTQETLPGYDRDRYAGWCYNGQPLRTFSPFIPVFEDMTLKLCTYEDLDENEGE